MRPLNSRRAEQERLHRIATREARELRCLVCGQYGCEPCHFPKHRGMGGYNAGWEAHEWVGLCRSCHDLVDGRRGVSSVVERQRRIAIASIERRRK